MHGAALPRLAWPLALTSCLNPLPLIHLCSTPRSTPALLLLARLFLWQNYRVSNSCILHLIKLNELMALNLSQACACTTQNLHRVSHPKPAQCIAAVPGPGCYTK